MQVRDIMSTAVTTAAPDMSLQNATKKMRELDVGCLPVGTSDKLVGMITDRDIACRAVANGREPANETVAHAMSKGIIYCFDDQDVNEATQLMGKQQVRRLPVLNRDKRLVGILSMSDLASRAAHELTGEVVVAVSRRHPH